jgi:hypothetical protein
MRTPYLMIAPLFFLVGIHALLAQSTHLSMGEIEQQYRAIRQMALDPELTLEVDRVFLKKDVAEFEFKEGRFYFFTAVSSRIVAAYFAGYGILRLTTGEDIERVQLARFYGQEGIELEFEKALFFFTDSTYEQLATTQPLSTLAIDDSIHEMSTSFRQRIRDRFEWNTDARLLYDIAGTSGYGEFFNAYLDCPDDSGMMYFIDPLDEEEVSLLRYEKVDFSTRAYWETWYSSHKLLPSSNKQPEFNIDKTEMDIVIDAKKEISVRADLDFVCSVPGVRVAPLELVPTLRVERAVLGDSDTCLIIQEGARADGQLWLVFPEELEKDVKYTLTITYCGGGIIEDIGGDNFAIMARTSWFPSFYTNPTDPRRFILKFAVPSKMTLLATGELAKAWTRSDTSYTIWDSRERHDFAGFNYGKFSAVTEKSKNCRIECYTNVKLADALLRIRILLEQYKELQVALMMLPHELTTDRIGKNAAIESRNAYEVYCHFFGEIPIREIKVSQQPQMSFAQSWPTLIYLPFTAFWDFSIKERLGLLSGEVSVMSFETIASHEIAHQWWGNTVMRDSYHDEWLTEGFATYSSALYLQATEGTDRFRDYMNIQRRQVLAKAEKDRSYSDLGPIWLGQRLNSLDFPGGRRLIYAKGAYVLHMLRMLLFDYEKKSDERFINMMKDYVATYSGRIVTTHDLQVIVEKHFDQDMGWFFDQWVYGTEIPVYSLRYDVEETGGEYYLTIHARQSGVSPSFRMPVPFLVNFEKEHAVVKFVIEGSDAVAKKFHLPQRPRSIEPNPWNAVLCTIPE